MSSALDRFEQSLVRASHTLHQQQSAGGRRRSALRSRGWRIPAGALVIGVLAAAGTSLLGPTGNPREIAQFECGENITASVTGEPVRDCATLWPSMYHHAPPALVAWVAETGGAVVVTPVGRPPAGDGWRQLPSGWTADSAVLLLHTQLEDITTGIEARPCWSAPAASALVAAMLRTDELDSVAHPRQNRTSKRRAPQLPEGVGVDGHRTALGAAGRAPRARACRMVPDVPKRTSRTCASDLHGDARQYHAERRRALCERATGGGALALKRSCRRHPHSEICPVHTVKSRQHGGLRHVFVDAPGGGGPADVYAAKLP